MDTKLRSISRHTLTKLLVFILVIVFITAATVQLTFVLFMEYNLESIVVSDYTASRSGYKNEINNAFHSTLWLIQEDKSIDKELDVPSGTVLEEETETSPQGTNETGVEIETEAQDIEIINEDKDYLFYITNGIRTITNKEGYTKEDFGKHDESFVALENGKLSYGSKANQSNISWFSAEEAEDVTMYIAYPDEFMKAQELKWEEDREIILPIAYSFIAFVLLATILIIYLMVVTGRKSEDEELHLTWVDKIYTEFMVGGFTLIGLGWLAVGAYTISNTSKVGDILTSGQRTSIYLLGFVTVVSFSLCGVIFLALIRKFKGRRFIKDMLTYKFFYNIFHRISGFFKASLDFLRSFFDGRRFEKYPLTKSLHQRQIAFIVASFILVFLTFAFIAVPPLMIFPPILEIVIIYWYVKYNNKTFEDINKGFNESLEEQMKSERMKINLVTNVSHDLKTPLTSIISYVDLLSKEEGLSEIARDYVNILMEKSNRLKNIVADLFDLAKSTSGAMNVDFEELDLKKLIEQTLGDMGDDIEKSGLTIKTNLPGGALMIRSDGKKLYRVFQNIIDNALKYSLQGTRIFVELEEKDNMAIATVKNTAGYEMDFMAEDILQRFNRGDESRTTEGSGLGLSIAESFTEVSGGNFKVDIDGDMFKVIIGFEKIK